jgi:hypothetical protein
VGVKAGKPAAKRIKDKEKLNTGSVQKKAAGAEEVQSSPERDDGLLAEVAPGSTSKRKRVVDEYGTPQVNPSSSKAGSSSKANRGGRGRKPKTGGSGVKRLDRVLEGEE